MKLLKNIYQVGGPGLTHPFDAAVYLLKGTDGYFLVDCGSPEGYPQILEQIRLLGIEPKDITKILATHGHYDHVGSAHLWREAFGCSLFLHRADRNQVEAGDSVKTSAALLYGTVSVPCPVDEELEDGMIFPGDGLEAEVLHTPGHTMGSVCVSVQAGADRLLIAGDTIWGGFSDKIGSDETAWRKSLKKLTALHFDYYTFGHMNPVLFSDANTRLKEAEMAFGNYYNPWFKTFYETYRY